MKRLLLAAALALALPAWATTAIVGGDPRLLYTGRIDLAHAGAPQMSWPGSSVAGNFTGRFLSVTLDDQFGNNWFNVFIDDDLAHPLVVHAKQGEQTIVLATRLAPGRHAFLLTKRTEGEDGATTIARIELADGATPLPPPARPTRRIEFFGDSITSGMGNESPDDGPDDRRQDKNNFMAYDAITARSLDAELHVTSQSGIGILVSWFPFVMPQFYGQLNAVGRNDSRWDFSTWTPQVVVINLLQNDRWLIEREHRLDPEPTDAQRIQAYVDFVGTIRKKYPDAFIVCALGNMDATQTGSKWPGYVRDAVARLKQEQGDGRIDTLFFEFTGFGAHPRVKHHQAMAARLTAFIKDKMHW
ncbi:MAG: SGNH/GDSL hydrolase family protein [Betaproteobacteria bacterium]